MQTILVLAIKWFSDIIILALCLRAVFSWLAQDPYSNMANIYRLLVKITEPVVAPCRSLLSRFNTGMIDLSVLAAFFLVEIVAKVLIRLIYMFF